MEDFTMLGIGSFVSTIEFTMLGLTVVTEATPASGRRYLEYTIPGERTEYTTPGSRVEYTAIES